MDGNRYRTPEWLYEWASSKWPIVVDLAADDRNHLCDIYITREQNTLNVCWSDMFGSGTWGFLNPPYDELDAFFGKCDREASRGGFGIVALVPSFQGEHRWARHVYGKAREVYSVDGRIKFGHPETGVPSKKTATFGSSVIVWQPREEGECVETVSRVLWQAGRV